MKLGRLFTEGEGESTWSAQRNGSLSHVSTRRLILTIVVVGLVTVLIFNIPVYPVRGQSVGLVCLAPSTANACPAAPVTMSASVGSQLTIAVLVQGSDSFNGFDITLKANHTSLNPAGASLAGSLLAGGSVNVECLGGYVAAGSSCSPTDTVDTLHFAVESFSLTFPPTSGLLFTAVYNVTSSTTANIAYQTGCSVSSVSGTTTCVLFTNGSITAPLETVQNATYTVTPVPTFTLGASQGEMTFAKGLSDNLTLLLASLNGFAANVTFYLTVNPTARHPPSFSVSPLTASLSAGGSATALFLVSTRSNTDKLTYDVTISATGGGASGSLHIPVTIIA